EILSVVSWRATYIVPRSDWHAQQYPDHAHQAMLYLRQRSLGKYRLGISSVEDVQIALKELPQVLGQRPKGLVRAYDAKTGKEIYLQERVAGDRDRPEGRDRQTSSRRQEPQIPRRRLRHAGHRGQYALSRDCNEALRIR